MRRPTRVLAATCLIQALGLGPLGAQATAPVLKARSLEGANLDFTGGASLQDVLQRLGKAGGVTITLHASVAAQDANVRIDLRNLPFQQALDTVLLQNNLFAKVLSPDSLMVFKKTPQNLMEFEARSNRTFTLSHADPDSVRQTLNALMPQVRVFPDKRLHALSIQGNATELAAAQALVENLDKPKGEVGLEIEILEAGPKAVAAAGLARETSGAAVDRALETLRKDGATRLVAKPHLRVMADEAGEIRVGQVQPEAAAAKDAGDRVQTGGFRLRVKPRIHADGTLTLALDYASLAPAKGAQDKPLLDERALRTSVQVKEGEAVAFGGLLADETGGAPRDRILVLKARVIRKADNK
ncbi:MAG TPA: secretin N-terminal domain-containing protein [Holophaga sp.]|nr:secretin N-terminal domain-containing protein [Holophaga sp.]